MSVTSVGQCLDETLMSFNVREFTLEKSGMSVMNLQSFSKKDLYSLNIRYFTLERSHMTVENVGCPFV